MKAVRVETAAESIRTVLAAALAGGPALLPDPTDALRHSARPDEPVEDDIALLVPTSGSTRAPKVVELSAAALSASATATHEVLGGAGQWLLCLPLTHVAGLQVLVRSLLGGSIPVILQPGPFRPAAFVAAARTLDAGRRYVSLVPTQLSRLLDDAPAAAALTRFDAVLLGGGAVAPRVLARAGALGIGLRTTYGMSETAGGCFYDGLPLPGAGATIEDGGRIVLSGPMLARRYRGDPGATSAAFVDGRFRSADAGRFTADGRLQVLGRLDDVIVTGGRKVHPLEVQEVLGRVPQVVEAFVAGVPDAQWGQAVTAWVVPHPGVARDGLLDTLRAAVRLELGPPAVPKAIRLVEEIPRLTSGKTDRRRLVDEASAGGAHRPGA